METYQQEILTPKLMAEVNVIMDDLYANTAAKVNRPPFDFDWVTYVTIQDRLLITTVRDGEELLGFTIYLVVLHSHHASMWVAECDSIIVKPSARGRGLGTKLYEFTEPLLRELGVKYISHRHRTVYSVEPMFPKLGFQLEELVYIKRID